MLVLVEVLAYGIRAVRLRTLVRLFLPLVAAAVGQTITEYRQSMVVVGITAVAVVEVSWFRTHTPIPLTKPSGIAAVVETAFTQLLVAAAVDTVAQVALKQEVRLVVLVVTVWTSHRGLAQVAQTMLPQVVAVEEVVLVVRLDWAVSQARQETAITQLRLVQVVVVAIHQVAVETVRLAKCG